MRLIFIILFLVCSQFFFDALHSQESVCNDGSLSQEQVVECEYNQKNNPDWTKDYNLEENIQLRKQEEKQEELKRKQKEIAKKKQQEIAKKKTIEVKLKALKALKEKRSKRGKFGLSFSMTDNEVVCNDETPTYISFDLLFGDGSYRKGSLFCVFEEIEGVRFVSKFGKGFGEYTASTHSDLKKKLSSKYKVLYKPSSADFEKWISDFSGKRLTYVFENEHNLNEPKYIF